MKFKFRSSFNVRAVVFSVLSILFLILFFVLFITLTGYAPNGPIIWLTRLTIPKFEAPTGSTIEPLYTSSLTTTTTNPRTTLPPKSTQQFKSNLTHSLPLKETLHPRKKREYVDNYRWRTDKYDNTFYYTNDLMENQPPSYDELTGLPLTKYSDRYYRNYYSTKNARKQYLYFPSIPVDYPSLSTDPLYSVGYSHEFHLGLILVGVGLLYTSIKCTGFSGIAMTYFLVAFTFLWSCLVVPWIMQASFNVTSPEEIFYNIRLIMELMYCVLAIVIAYGALVGRISRIQMLVMAIFGVLLYAVNRMVVVRYIVAQDAAGSMTVHTFGAFYGLAISYAVFAFYKSCYYKDPCCVPADYTQSLISFIGTLFLFVFFPKFNAYFALLGTEMYERAYVNTFFALTSCIVLTYALSTFVTRCQKMDIMHLSRSIIAAGAALSSIAVLNLDIWGAVLVGSLAAILSVLSLAFIQPYLCKIYIYDPIGIFSTFLIGGLLGGIVSAVMAALVPHLGYTDIEMSMLYPSMLIDFGPGAIRGHFAQGGYQMVALISSIGIAIVGGLLVGLIIRYMGPLDDDEIYDDNTFFNLRGCDGNAICEGTKCGGTTEQRQQQETDC